MVKTRSFCMILVLLLIYPAFSIAAEQDSGSFFRRTRKVQAEKKAFEPLEVLSPSVEYAAEEPKILEMEPQIVQVPPKLPAEPIRSIQGMYLPPQAPQVISQLPPSIPSTPAVLKPQTTPVGIQIQAKPVQISPERVISKPVLVDYSTNLSHIQDVQSFAPQVKAELLQPSLIPAVASTPNTPNTPAKTPAIPKTK